MLCLLGKSCAGKDTIQKELIKMGMESVVSYTTRPPRPGEIDGVAYHFITKEDYIEKAQSNFFAETTSYDVAIGDTWCYGSTIEDLTDEKVAIINPHSLRQLRQISSLNLIAFYITATEEVIWNRLRERGDNLAEAERRFNADNRDFYGIEKYIDFMFRSDSGLKPVTLAEIILYTYNKVIKDRNEQKHIFSKCNRLLF